MYFNYRSSQTFSLEKFSVSIPDRDFIVFQQKRVDAPEAAKFQSLIGILLYFNNTRDSICFMPKIVSIPDRDFIVFQRCRFYFSPLIQGVSIPDRDFIVFQQQKAAERVTALEFQSLIGILLYFNRLPDSTEF